MDKERKNRKEANKQCRKCKWLHAGIKVDHNHCDVRYTNSDTYDSRANGRNKSKCFKFKRKEGRVNKMPYIKQEQRKEFEDIIKLFGQKSGRLLREIETSYSTGEMNYLISSLLHIYLHHKGLCYINLNEVIGLLECIKQELYRQIASPYEDKKKNENGSVSNLDGG